MIIKRNEQWLWVLAMAIGVIAVGLVLGLAGGPVSPDEMGPNFLR